MTNQDLVKEYYQQYPEAPLKQAANDLGLADHQISSARAVLLERGEVKKIEQRTKSNLIRKVAEKHAHRLTADYDISEELTERAQSILNVHRILAAH